MSVCVAGWQMPRVGRGPVMSMGASGRVESNEPESALGRERDVSKEGPCEKCETKQLT